MLGSAGPAAALVREKPEPLPADPAAFWQGGAAPEDLTGELEPPPVAAALVKRLGKFPLWRGARPLVEVMETLYRGASERAQS